MRNNHNQLSTVHKQASNFLTTVPDLVKGTYTVPTQHHVMNASVYAQCTPLKKG